MQYAPIPVTVITGFLGSGKTTLINRLLRDPALTDTAVIVNEFGEVAIDHMLVETSSDGVIELADGCLCCSVRGELIDTLADLADRLQTGRIERLSRVVVETTGLADPVPVLQSLMAHPAILAAYRLDGVVATLDAANGAATLDRHREAMRQAAVADRIVITKSDIATAEQVTHLADRIARINPGAPLLDAQSGAANAAGLMECGLYDPATKSVDVRRWLKDAAADAGADGHDHDAHDHDDGHHHGHRHHHHDARIRSVSLAHEGAMPLAAVEGFLDLLRATHGEKLLRMKGVIETVEDPEHPLVVHGVQKLLHPPARLAAWPPGPRGARLVLITDDMPEDYVKRLFDAFAGKPAVDMPDRSALEDNPLAIAGFSAR
ncbi:CobW family GTP-binding protein [Mesorhizobium xinjiangense]|uniref:CobW family GTP-binding protein n=1 Tax=Mesorhizobium xinjiangense TaxID=2678685 RepID=UPI0012ECD7F5|nr:GTP-binding protein [Mesorhizobium xinjiangense]